MTAVFPLESFADEASATPEPLLPSFEPVVEPVPEDPGDGPDLHAAYDLGFRTGKEASEHDFSLSQERLSHALIEALQTLTFTWREARTHVVAGLAPLLRAMVSQVLPRVAASGWGELVVAELLALAEGAADAPLTLVVSPKVEPKIARLLADGSLRPFRLMTDPSLSAQQALLRLGDQHEALLDIDGVIASIDQKVSAFLNSNQKDIAHG